MSRAFVILGGEIVTPPLSEKARRYIGHLLRKVQHGDMLSMPISRPMPSIGKRCHELRVQDPETANTWRVVYRIDEDAIVILEVFAKKTQATPQKVIATCRARLRDYDT